MIIENRAVAVWSENSGEVDRRPDDSGAIIVGAGVESKLGLTVEVETPGNVLVRAPLTADVVRPGGEVHRTLPAVMSDAATGLAVFSGLDWRAIGTTAELRVDHLGEPAADAEYLLASGSFLGATGDFGTARVDLRDDRGNPVAHAVGIMSIEKVALEAWMERGSATFAEFELEEIAVDGGGPGEAFAAITSGMLNFRNAVHGGVLMGLAHEAQDAFFATEADYDFRRLRLCVDYLRPAPSEGRLVFRSTVVRGGRRLRTVRTEIAGSDGKVVAVATGTTAATARTY